MGPMLTPAPDRRTRKSTSPSGSRCRRRYLGLSDEEMDARIAAAKRDARPRAGHPRPSLPARRGDQVRRLHRRLVQARAAGRASIPTPSSSSSAACTSWPRAPTCCSAPHQQVILPDLAAGCSMADMADPDQLEMCWSELEQMGVDDATRRSRSPTSTRPRRSKRSSASTAASSAPRRTPRRR